MKTARDLFEELGYKMDNEWEEYGDLYYYIDVSGRKRAVEIWFDLREKQFVKCIDCFCEGNARCISMQELQAINKQVSELGWFDE